MNTNNEILDFEEIKKDAEENLTAFGNIVIKELTEVANYTISDIDKLLKLIFQNCQDLTELEGYTNILKNRIIENEMLIDKFLYQKDLTKKDIIDENIINIYLVSNGAFLLTCLLSQNPHDFIKNFFVTALIGITSFDINLRYFSSEKHKKQLEDNIELLKNTIEINKYDITTFNKFRELYIKELSFEAQKLVEITQNNDKDDNYNRIKAFLKGLNIDFVLETEPNKAKIKKKNDR